MPDRVIRDELLRSHRYRTLTSDTVRLLFIHLLLSVDSLGNAEATSTAIGDTVGRQVDDPTVAKWLAELQDADLVRLYSVERKLYVHVPRFRQRLRYIHGKHPRPPKEIECSEINALLAKVGPQADRGQTVVGRSDKKRREVNTLAPTAVAFDAVAGWSGISAEDRAVWSKAYPALDLEAQLSAAAAWARANPKNRKSNWRRFLTNWLARSQDKAPPAGGERLGPRRVSL